MRKFSEADSEILGKFRKHFRRPISFLFSLCSCLFHHSQPHIPFSIPPFSTVIAFLLLAFKVRSGFFLAINISGQFPSWVSSLHCSIFHIFVLFQIKFSFITLNAGKPYYFIYLFFTDQRFVWSCTICIKVYSLWRLLCTICEAFTWWSNVFICICFFVFVWFIFCGVLAFLLMMECRKCTIMVIMVYKSNS